MQGFFDIVAVVVHGKAFDDVFAQPLGGPYAKLRATMRLHPVANGNDDIEVEVINLICFAVNGSGCKFCNN